MKTQAFDEEASIKKGAGIQIRLYYPFIGVVFQALCPGHWEMCSEGGWIYQPDVYPSGEVLLAAGSGSNPGGYDNAEMDTLLKETTTDGSLALNQKDSTFHTSFAQWSATDVPYLWQPTPASVLEVNKSMVGAPPPNPLGDLNPEYITKL